MVSEYSDPRCPICGAAYASCGGPASSEQNAQNAHNRARRAQGASKPGAKAIAGPPEDKAIRPRENKGGGE